MNKLLPNWSPILLHSIVDLSIALDQPLSYQAYVVVMRSFDDGEDGYTIWLGKN